MRIFDNYKIKEIQKNEVNLLTEKLVEDKLFVCHHDAIQEVQKQSHFEVVRMYPNGGKDLKEVVDVEYVKPQEAFDEYENILKVEPLTKEEILNNLRRLREEQCFSVVNRGMVWYSQIDSNQNLELLRWYKEWLDITDKYVDGIDISTIIPVKPSWLK